MPSAMLLNLSVFCTMTSTCSEKNKPGFYGNINLDNVKKTSDLKKYWMFYKHMHVHVEPAVKMFENEAQSYNWPRWKRDCVNITWHN